MKSQLKIYNTLSQKKEVLRPRTKNRLNLFVCGPTVYDLAHIGHARTYIFFDFLAKYLTSLGYKIFYLQNITDVDDKIIKRAKELKTTPKALARKFEKEYFKDIKALGIDSISKYARATDHIKEIISQIKRLLKKKFAYKTSDGIYYDIKKFKNYGKLSGRTVKQAEDATSRMDESVHKKNKGDFCLWKFSKPEDLKEIRWQSPWGFGRPGWHIEDTAITEKYFGPQYDIHGGARDLIFPHHEAEIAQMEAISGKTPMVKYWMHTGFLTIGGKKMSKSLGNFITIREFLKSHSARVLRFLVLKTHYRSPIDYNYKAVEQTKKELARIDEFVYKLNTYKTSGRKINSKFETKFQNIKLKFRQALTDDLNTPKALAAVFELVHEVNKLIDQGNLEKRQIKEILKFLREIDVYFQFIFEGKSRFRIPTKILKLVAKREKYRAEKNWSKADKLREKINKMGYVLEDTPNGPKIKRIQ